MKDDDPKWIELCERHQAWNRAMDSWAENGLNEDAKWKRCVKSGNISMMDDACWTMLINANPGE